MKAHFYKKAICLCCIYTLTYISSLAQDSHYWSQQFGARSSLLGGAVVGSTRDVSSTYYNPGALALIDSIEVSVNSDLYKIENLKVTNALGEGNSINFYDYNISPQLISGKFNIDKKNRFHLALSLISKSNSNINFNERVSGEYGIFSPDEKIPFVSAFEYQNTVLDQWGGISFAYKINPHISIGTTFYLSYKNVNYRYFRYSRAIAVWPDSNVASQTDYQVVNFRNCRFISKSGIAFDYHPFKFGIAFTSPSFGDFSPGDLLGGSGVQRELSGVNFEDYVDEIYIDKQDKLPVVQKQPWSVAAGLSLNIKPIHIHTSAEYFSHLGMYNVMTPEEKEVSLKPMFKKSSVEFMSVYQQSNAVFNYAAGLEIDISKKIQFLCGYARDNSVTNNFLDNFGEEGYYDPIYMPYSYWNINDVSAGMSYKRITNQFTIGVVYGFANVNNHRNWINYNEPGGVYLTSPVQNNASTSYNSLNIVVGYNQNF